MCIFLVLWLRIGLLEGTMQSKVFFGGYWEWDQHDVLPALMQPPEETQYILKAMRLSKWSSSILVKFDYNLVNQKY